MTILLILSVFLYISFANKSSSNTWNIISNTHLPSSIYGHSIGIFNNELYIIGGDYSSQFPSFSTFLYHTTVYKYNVTNYTQIRLNTNPSSSTWKSVANIVDNRYLNGFKCKGQCSTTYNEYIFIINPARMFWDETGFLLIYNMETSSFINSTTFNNTLIYKEPGICSTNNGTHIFAIGSKCHKCSAAYPDIQGFDISNNGPWIILGHMNIGRYYSGCNVDKYNEYLYIFGGYLNHNYPEETGDVSDYIEKCVLFESEITCYNITNTKLAIPRAEHQVIVNRDGLMFIIGGINKFGLMEEAVEIYDVSNNMMMNNEWYTYINDGINGFATFYDEIWDIIYIVGGMDNGENVKNSIQYLAICQLYNNCYINKLDFSVNLQCGDNINISIDAAHDIHRYYFEIIDIDQITSIHFNNCPSNIDTYVYIFKWNDTSKQWRYEQGEHWDDGGNCNGHYQEEFTRNYPEKGYYQLWLSAHEAGIYSASFLCTNNTFEPTLEPTINPTLYPTQIPTQITMEPTVNPTMYPTQNPTENTIDPTYKPSITPTMDPITNPTKPPSVILVTQYDKIWFLLSFICRTQQDLSEIDWKLLILNGLLLFMKRRN